MSTLIVCDHCGERLDSPDLHAKEQHIRAKLVYERLGQTDIVVERDFCTDCGDEKRQAFEAAPFVAGLSRPTVSA